MALQIIIIITIIIILILKDTWVIRIVIWILTLNSVIPKNCPCGCCLNGYTTFSLVFFGVIMFKPPNQKIFKYKKWGQMSLRANIADGKCYVAV